MQTWVVPANPTVYDARGAFKKLGRVHWKQGHNKSAMVGDIVYIYESITTKAMILKTRIIERDVTDYDIADNEFNVGNVDFESNPPWFTLELISELPTGLDWELLVDLGVKGSFQTMRRLDVGVVVGIEEFIEGVVEEERTNLLESEVFEGGKKVVYTTKYERNPRNRARAIEIHGAKCDACGFDFERQYGVRGKSFIEIHHTKPLYMTEGETLVDPEQDLVPLCANCHRMIHRRRDAILTVSELRELVTKPYSY